MRTSVIASIVVVLVIIVAAGAWLYMSTRNTPIDATTKPSAQEPVVTTQPTSVIGGSMAVYSRQHEQHGSILTGFNYMTLYTFAKDKGTESTCYDQCALNWPPYVVAPNDDLTHIGAGVKGNVSFSLRNDGNRQLTYNGHPLYFYAKDKDPDDTTGQGIDKVWSVVKP